MIELLFKPIGAKMNYKVTAVNFESGYVYYEQGGMTIKELLINGKLSVKGQTGGLFDADK